MGELGNSPRGVSAALTRPARGLGRPDGEVLRHYLLAGQGTGVPEADRREADGEGVAGGAESLGSTAFSTPSGLTNASASQSKGRQWHAGLPPGIHDRHGARGAAAVFGSTTDGRSWSGRMSFARRSRCSAARRVAAARVRYSGGPLPGSSARDVLEGRFGAAAFRGERMSRQSHGRACRRRREKRGRSRSDRRSPASGC